MQESGNGTSRHFTELQNSVAVEAQRTSRKPYCSSSIDVTGQSDWSEPPL